MANGTKAYKPRSDDQINSLLGPLIAMAFFASATLLRASYLVAQTIGRWIDKGSTRKDLELTIVLAFQRWGCVVCELFNELPTNVIFVPSKEVRVLCPENFWQYVQY